MCTNSPNCCNPLAASPGELFASARAATGRSGASGTATGCCSEAASGRSGASETGSGDLPAVGVDIARGRFRTKAWATIPRFKRGGWYVVQYYHLEDAEWLDLPAVGVDIALHGSSAVVSNVDGLSWLRVRAASCAGGSEWSQIDQLLLANPSQWEDVPVPEVENGDKIEPCPEDIDTPETPEGAPVVRFLRPPETISEDVTGPYYIVGAASENERISITANTGFILSNHPSTATRTHCPIYFHLPHGNLKLAPVVDGYVPTEDGEQIYYRDGEPVTRNVDNSYLAMRMVTARTDGFFGGTRLPWTA